MSRCPLCPNKHNCVEADGPEGAEYLFIGEAPGHVEDRQKRVFCGPTGEELNRNYLPLAGLRRERVRVINAISCLPATPKGKLDSKKRDHLDLLNSCSNHFLIPEIRCNSYRLLIPMGAFACQALDPDIDLELQHGIPTMTAFGMAFPMFHPAGGLHEPKKMLHIRTDWIRLKKYLNGRLYLPKDKYEGREDYSIIQTASELRLRLSSPNRDNRTTSGSGNGFHHPLACDTEITRKRQPFCLTFSVQTGTGYMIMADRKDLLAVFQEYLDQWSGPILFHNYLFDEQVVRRMGLEFPWRLIVDTMAKAFHIGNVPQGLKAIAYRELGMQMQDFEDLVKPYSKTLILSYLEQARWHDWPKPEPETYRDGEQWKTKQPQGMNTKLKRFFTDYEKNPETKDIFGAWQNWPEAHEMIEGKVGEYPGVCITHAPIDKVIKYACRDSDATLRWYLRVKQIEKRVRKTLAENWGDC